ncbi:MAG: FAD-dependent thymidylate synthase [Candidatus Ancaeobacter aquaticus]|nr:FAD-dependent thymidylate synthase [Candidatus Ancaeobacter aquaticus]
MELLLAGFNVDVETLKSLNNGTLDHSRMTPETLSAAYARISRSPKPVNELRALSRSEVEKSRKSNKNIIFKMGHHSVAEHAVFNFDIIGVSRFAIEEVEKFRLCSYTEKSQRYITLDGAYTVPEEIKGSPHEALYVECTKELNNFYQILYEKLKDHVFKKYAELAEDKKNHSLLEGWAKEDARYITPLANTGQLGQTINARNLELLLRRFSSHPLKEVQMLGKYYYDLVEKIAPSIILFHEANEYDQKTYSEVSSYVKPFLQGNTDSNPSENLVTLCEYPHNADNITVAALMHTSAQISFSRCMDIAQKMSDQEKEGVVKTSCKHMAFYDTVLREYEHSNYVYDLIVSAACFGQLKRHRMATLTTQPYDPSLGVTIPPSIKEIGMESSFLDMVHKSAEVYDKIAKDIPHAAPYVLTNAHRRRVLFTANARELYHVARLRDDQHAQWDIREVASVMTEEVRKVAPLTMLLSCGKDKYTERYQEVYGKEPRSI